LLTLAAIGPVKADKANKAVGRSPKLLVKKFENQDLGDAFYNKLVDR
jgi:hypothetical protein